MLIKVCGLLDEENIAEVCRLEIDMIGLNFYKPSKRYLGEDKADLFQNIPASIKKVGVFVNTSIEDLRRINTIYDLDYLQLHKYSSSNTYRV